MTNALPSLSPVLADGIVLGAHTLSDAIAEANRPLALY